ncbi:butyrophilin-like protein 2 isoform X2 [Paramisgurnus dabryanus]|uniref:butyrophilin-like protein 2 isoform X2 n=1 Tax=Paramisgurnus dabryanus TaxID=90735 RepID=UPI0031F34B60
MIVNKHHFELKLCFGVMEFICVTLMIIIGITDSTGPFNVVGPVAPLLAIPGKDVILPCSLNPKISAVDMRVEWFRLDLKVVHLYEDHEDNNINQLQSYRGRTEVFKDELQKGNTSLKLSRVQISDEGLYTCFIESKTWYDDITVDLRVKTVVGPVAPLITVVGEDVILPCSLKPQISAVDMRVEWFRLDLEVVHLYEDHEDKNTNQLQSYRGRTEMFKDELQKGNTALKLSRVQISDEGLYTCFIQSKTWHDDITVDLRVKDQFDVVGPVAPLFAIAGKDVILPCSLKPNINAVSMRVKWFRLDLKDSVVHLYEDHEDKNTNQLQSYRGRTEVFKDELQKGNTSLKLSRVQVSDEGAYNCFIQYKTWSYDINIDLRVEAVGSPPLITVDGSDGYGGLHLQCESKGWDPEPGLVWLDSEGVTLTSETTNTQRETDGFRVKHMITVYNRDSKYHCRVTMGRHMMETEIITSSELFSSWKTTMIWISFAVLFVVIAVFCCKGKCC